MAAFEVVSRHVVLYGDRSYTPSQKLVEGRMFCSIQKWSSPLVKIMTGKRLDLRKDRSSTSGSLNIPLWDDLLDARQKASDRLLEEALRDDEADSGNEPKKKKAKKEKVKALAKHVHLLPSIIDIEIEVFQLSILTEGLSTGNIWMEMLAENFTWMKDIADQQMPAERSTRKKSRSVKDSVGEEGSSDTDAEDAKKKAISKSPKAKAKPATPKSVPKIKAALNRGIAASPTKVKK